MHLHVEMEMGTIEFGGPHDVMDGRIWEALSMLANWNGNKKLPSSSSHFWATRDPSHPRPVALFENIEKRNIFLLLKSRVKYVWLKGSDLPKGHLLHLFDLSKGPVQWRNMCKNCIHRAVVPPQKSVPNTPYIVISMCLHDDKEIWTQRWKNLVSV